MKIVYASRTGNVQSIVQRLGFTDALEITSGNETIEEDYVLFTYTDGFGDIPYEVEDFLQSNSNYLKGVIVSGDLGYAEAYHVPCLYKVENDGSEEDLKAIKEKIASL